MDAKLLARDTPPEMPGVVDYECRTAIRDLIRLYGFEEARMKVANYLNDEADRSRPYAPRS